MTPTYARRRAGDLRRRCPVCKRLRKYREPPGDQGGVGRNGHPRRPRWGFIYVMLPLGKVDMGIGVPLTAVEYKRVKACGWCVARFYEQINVDTGRTGKKRNAKTGRIER